jgi:hypothetical protein
MSDQNTKLDGTLSKIDAALKAAEARKAAKVAAAGGNASKVAGASKPAAKKVSLTDTEKAAKVAARDADRTAKKAVRDAARAEKKAAKEANRKPAHMLKVMKAAAKLPKLNSSAEETVNDITSNYSRDQINAISLHLQHFNRVKATERALTQKVEAGMQVRICGGDPRFIGMTGVVAQSQRIRCYVTVPGAKKNVYLFTSDVEAVTANKSAKTGK